LKRGGESAPVGGILGRVTPENQPQKNLEIQETSSPQVTRGRPQDNKGIPKVKKTVLKSLMSELIKNRKRPSLGREVVEDRLSGEENEGNFSAAALRRETFKNRTWEF